MFVVDVEYTHVSVKRLRLTLEGDHKIDCLIYTIVVSKLRWLSFWFEWCNMLYYSLTKRLIGCESTTTNSFACNGLFVLELK